MLIFVISYIQKQITRLTFKKKLRTYKEYKMNLIRRTKQRYYLVSELENQKKRRNLLWIVTGLILMCIFYFSLD